MTTAAIAVVSAVLIALWWRRGFLRERPLLVWDREWTGPTACTKAIAEEHTLRVETLSPGWEWLVDLSLAPVWFFWGDLRTRRPTRQLRRFRLTGTHADRDVRVSFGDDELTLSINAVAVSLWADAARPLREQEGVRTLFPVDGERWANGTAALERLFALGVARVSAADGRLRASGPIGSLRPESWDHVFAGLVALAHAAQG